MFSGSDERNLWIRNTDVNTGEQLGVIYCLVLLASTNGCYHVIQDTSFES
jgi:hypothetical protein